MLKLTVVNNVLYCVVFCLVVDSCQLKSRLLARATSNIISHRLEENNVAMRVVFCVAKT